MSAAPSIRGTNQLPNPPIKIGITMKKIIMKRAPLQLRCKSGRPRLVFRLDPVLYE